MVGRERDPLFVAGADGTSTKVELPSVSEELLQLGVDVPINAKWTVQTGALIRRWHGGLADSARTPTPLGVGLRIDHADETRPQFGRLDLEWNQRYKRASAHFSLLTRTPIAQLTSTIRAGATSVDAPYSQWFLLGGTDGFPGLNVGESIDVERVVHARRRAPSVRAAEHAGHGDDRHGEQQFRPHLKVWLFGARSASVRIRR
jgi:hypothetical protein